MAALRRDTTLATPKAMEGREGAREMYRLFLECDYTEALALAREVLDARPDDPIALVIESECVASLKQRGIVVPASSRADVEPASGVSLVGERTVREGDLRTRVWEAAPPSSTRRATLYELFLRGDHEDALAAAEEILAHAPGDPMAQAIVSECRALLRRTDSVPVLACSMEAVAMADIDPRAAFVLSRVDGVSTVESITDVTGMPEAETMHVLEVLVAKGILRLEPPR